MLWGGTKLESKAGKRLSWFAKPMAPEMVFDASSMLSAIWIVTQPGRCHDLESRWYPKGYVVRVLRRSARLEREVARGYRCLESRWNPKGFGHRASHVPPFWIVNRSGDRRCFESRWHSRGCVVQARPLSAILGDALEARRTPNPPNKVRFLDCPPSIEGSSNGRTVASEATNLGSSPSPSTSCLGVGCRYPSCALNAAHAGSTPAA